MASSAGDGLVQAAFPKGNLYAALRTEFGTLYHAQLFADLDLQEGSCDKT